MSTATPTVKDSAAALRAALKATFPGVKFSARIATGTAYGWVTVRWEGGPSEAEVRAVTSQFKGERWDSLEGYYRPTGNPHALSGIIHQRTPATPRRAS